MGRSPAAAAVVLPAVVAVFLLATGAWASSWTDDLVIELPSDNVTSLNIGGATPCCDKCGICLGSTCTCNDIVKTCPSWCHVCLPSLLPPFNLVCKDYTADVCKTKCTAPPPPPFPPPPPPSPPPPSPSPPPPSPPPPSPSPPPPSPPPPSPSPPPPSPPPPSPSPPPPSPPPPSPSPPPPSPPPPSPSPPPPSPPPPSPSPPPPSASPPPPPSFSPPPPPHSPSPPPPSPPPPSPLPSPPCCDRCGICKGSSCKCNDGLSSCPKWCKSCTRSLLFPFNYICDDYVDNICQTRCTPAPPPPPPPVCCDHCGYCDSIVPLVPKRCRCRDMLSSCPLWCSKCTQFAGLYECLDLKLNYCSKTCTAK